MSRTAKAAPRKRAPAKSKVRSASVATAPSASPDFVIPFCIVTILAIFLWWFQSRYSVALQSPVVLHFRSPLVISRRDDSEAARLAQTDQKGRRLSGWQQYACTKFGKDCRIALAIQRAENPQGKCEIYHYNANGTLDWGYFQVNTVHLQRPGLNLRDLLDCKANIDFAYQLYKERGGFTPWSTYNSGLYRKFYSPE